MRFFVSCVLLGLLAGQGGGQPDWDKTDAETLEHFQALIRFDTSDPPGGEKPAVDYLKGVLEREGIPVEVFALEAHRPNLVARLKGNGKKRPLLIMAHTDVGQRRPQEVDPSAVRRRSATAATSTAAAPSTTRTTSSPSLMTMLLLKRLNVPLDRDVIFLAEAGEEGTTRVGIQFMADAALRRRSTRSTASPKAAASRAIGRRR